jgi:hypothetical protein
MHQLKDTFMKVFYSTVLIYLLLYNPECNGQVSTFQMSTYDNPQWISRIKSHKESLKLLNDKKIFSIVQDKLIPKLGKDQLEYFKSKQNYVLLYFAKGDIFFNKNEDYLFVVYDKQNIRISLIAFNDLTNRYLELYRDVKVENGLESVDCNYSSFGTLDYQIADNIIYQEEFLIKKPESFFDYEICKIIDISEDSNLVLEEGCFTKKAAKKSYYNSNSICISTSTVYNNWECMRYDKTRNIFLIFYGQAFAD